MSERDEISIVHEEIIANAKENFEQRIDLDKQAAHEEMVSDFMSRLGMTEDEANDEADTALSVIVKDVLK